MASSRSFNTSNIVPRLKYASAYEGSSCKAFSWELIAFLYSPSTLYTFARLQYATGDLELIFIACS